MKLIPFDSSVKQINPRDATVTTHVWWQWLPLCWLIVQKSNKILKLRELTEKNQSARLSCRLTSSVNALLRGQQAPKRQIFRCLLSSSKANLPNGWGFEPRTSRTKTHALDHWAMTSWRGGKGSFPTFPYHYWTNTMGWSIDSMPIAIVHGELG